MTHLDAIKLSFTVSYTGTRPCQVCKRTCDIGLSTARADFDESEDLAMLPMLLPVHRSKDVRVVEYSRPGFREKRAAGISRAARELVSQHPTHTIPCPNKCGGNITLKLAEAFSPGSVTVCDKCGGKISAQGAFDEEGNRR
jgi:hypothetical protein